MRQKDVPNRNLGSFGPMIYLLLVLPTLNEGLKAIDPLKEEDRNCSFRPECNYTIEIRYLGPISPGNTGVFCSIDPDLEFEGKEDFKTLEDLRNV